MLECMVHERTGLVWFVSFALPCLAECSASGIPSVCVLVRKAKRKKKKDRKREERIDKYREREKLATTQREDVCDEPMRECNLVSSFCSFYLLF